MDDRKQKRFYVVGIVGGFFGAVSSTVGFVEGGAKGITIGVCLLIAGVCSLVVGVAQIRLDATGQR